MASAGSSGVRQPRRYPAFEDAWPEWYARLIRTELRGTTRAAAACRPVVERMARLTACYHAEAYGSLQQASDMVASTEEFRGTPTAPDSNSELRLVSKMGSFVRSPMTS